MDILVIEAGAIWAVASPLILVKIDLAPVTCKFVHMEQVTQTH